MCDFNKEDASDFVVDGKSAAQSDQVVFDGVMKPNTQFNIPVSDPVPLEDGFMCESEEIDFADYKKVEAVE